MVSPFTRWSGLLLFVLCLLPSLVHAELKRVDYEEPKDFSISFPLGWKQGYMETGQYEKYQGKAFPVKGQAFTPSIIIGSLEMQVPCTLEDWYQKTLRDCRDSIQNYNEGKNGNTTINGIPARWFLFTWTINGIPAESLSVVLLTDTRRYLIMAVTAEEDYQKLFPMLTATISTFKPKPFTPVTTSLLKAREGFTTKSVPSKYEPEGPATIPPANLFNLIKYTSPAGQLAAYVTPDPGDGKKHPAVLWAHGGFGGIDEDFWKTPKADNDQTAQAFRKAGLVLMVPSWRGENDNPGKFEAFYGEVKDLLAARDYLAQLPYVDPTRIYLAGHSTGGTLILLATVSTDKFRAAFSFGGAPDITRAVLDGNYLGGFMPFDFRSFDESRLRSAINFTGAIQRPTFYFGGASEGYIPDALRMQTFAIAAGVPFSVFPVKNGDHFSILSPITALVAQKILQDTGDTCNITFTQDEVNKTFAAAFPEEE